MRLATIVTRGVPGVPDMEADLRRGEAPAQIVAVTGASGAGKTRLCDAIVAAKEATGAYGVPPDADAWVHPTVEASKITLGWWLDESERRFAGVRDPILCAEVMFVTNKPPRTIADPGLIGLLQRYEHGGASAKVDYFPSDRGLPLLSLSLGDPTYEQKTRRLSKGPAKYGALLRFAYQEHRSQSARWDDLVALFARMACGRHIYGVTATGLLEFDSALGDRVGLDRLSDADRMAFVFAATSVMVGHDRSVVLVDTPELHQPAGGAARMLGELASRFTNGQWIAATHDADVLAMAGIVIHIGGNRELLAAHG